MNLTEWRTAVQQQAGRLRERLADLARQYQHAQLDTVLDLQAKHCS